jgi:hypothetical protein
LGPKILNLGFAGRLIEAEYHLALRRAEAEGG